MAQLTVTLRANDQISSVLKKVQQSAQQTQNALNKVGASNSSTAGSATGTLSKLGSAAGTAQSLIGKALNFFSGFSNQAAQVPSLFQRISNSATHALAVVGGFSMVRGVFNSVKSSVSSAMSRLDTFDVFQRKMQLITGDSQQATYALNEMKDATKGTAYMLDTAAQTVQNFVTRGMSTQDATKSVRIWMDAVAAYGAGTNEQFEQVADAIAKMRTKGTVEMRYLNRLFAVGINPVQMYAQVVGRSTAEVQEALSAKEISADEFLNVVETAMREGTNGVIKVEGMAKDVATTWAATLANMRAAIARGVATLTEGIDAFLTPFTGMGIKGFFKEYGINMENFLGTLGGSFKLVGDTINQEVIHFKNKHQDLYTDLADTLESYDEKTKNVWTNLKTYISKTSNAAGSLFQDQFGTIFDTYLRVKKLFAEVWLTFSEGIAKVTPEVGKFLILFGGSIIDHLLKIAEIFGEFLKMALPNIFVQFEKFIEFVNSKAPQFNEFLDSIVARFKDFKDQLVAHNQDGTMNFIERIQEVIKGINFDTIISTIGDIITLISRFITELGPDLLNIFLELKATQIEIKLQVFRDLLQFMVDHPNITEMLFAIATAFEMMGGMSTVVTVLNGITGAFKGLWWALNAISKLLTGETLLKFLGSLIPGLSKSVAGGASSIGSSIGSFFTGIGDSVTVAIGSLNGALSAVPLTAEGLIAPGALAAASGGLMTSLGALASVANPVVLTITAVAAAFVGLGSIIDMVAQLFPQFQINMENLGVTFDRTGHLDWSAWFGIDSLKELKARFDAGEFKIDWKLIFDPETDPVLQYFKDLFASWVKNFTDFIDHIKDFTNLNGQGCLDQLHGLGSQSSSEFYNGFNKDWESNQGTIPGKFGALNTDVANTLESHSPSEVYIRFGQSVVEGFNVGITEGFDTYGASIVAPFQNLNNQITSALSPNALDSVGRQIATNFEVALDTSISQKGASIAQSITNMMGTVINSYNPAPVKALGEQIASDIKSGFDSKWGEMSSQIATSVSGIGAAITGSLNTAAFLDIGADVAMGIKQGFDAIWQMAVMDMTNDIANLPNEINSDALVSSFGTLAENMAQAFRDSWGKTVPAVIDTVSNKFNEMYLVTSAYLLSMRISIFTEFNNITDRIKEFVLDVAGYFDPLPKFMHDIAVEFMTELRDGINQQKDAVTSAISDLVLKMKNTFLEGMGIHSPSKFGIYVADMIGEGLMKLPQDKVAAFYDHVVGLMQQSFENGRFRPDELVNYLSENEVMTLVGKLTGVDASALSEQQIAYPLIGTLGTQTSWFGPRVSPGGIGSTNHGGVDLASPTGTPIAAALAGTIIQAGYNDGYGNSVAIDHGGGITTLYGHMSQIGTTVGANVAKGQQIGLVGSTGNSTGPHLHFEVRQNGTKIDPQPYLGGAGLVAGNTLSSAIQMALMQKKGINITALIGGLSGEMGSISAGAGVMSSDVNLTSIVAQALAMLGQPQSLIPDVLFAIQGESGGNPFSVNLSDSNAAAGHPSQGLLQLVPETFMQYRNPHLTPNILDPLANVYAGLNYMIKRYGSIQNVVNPRRGGWYGYEVGTRYVPEDMLAVIHQGEAIIPKAQNPYSKSGGDYLSDLIANANPVGFDLNAVQAFDTTGLDADLRTIQSPSTSSTSNTDNRSFVLNNSFNVTDKHTAELTANEIDRKLHSLLNQSMATGRKG